MVTGTRIDFDLPRCRTDWTGPLGTCWDVKFYPYIESAEEPVIFAAVSSSNIYIFDILVEDGSRIHIRAQLNNDIQAQLKYTLNSITWCHTDQSQPLVAAAGTSGHVEVYAVTDENLTRFTTLVGHGKSTVNDLITHPIYPWIIASASTDGSIRIWDLRRADRKSESACVIICGHGSAHKEGLLSIDWHDTGRYLVSAGFDHNICIWVLPDLEDKSSFWQSISKEERARSANEVLVIHYPHFVTCAIHADYVDRVMFYGDLILSKAAAVHQSMENTITLWSVTGFNSKLAPANVLAAPKTDDWRETRNGFMRRPMHTIDDDTASATEPQYRDVPPYQRRLCFKSDFTPVFYMRFGLVRPCPRFPSLHPVLSIGNAKGEVLFWDLERFELGHDGSLPQSTTSKHKAGTPFSMPHNLTRRLQAQRSPASSRRSSSAVASSDTNERSLFTDATTPVSELAEVLADEMTADRKKYPLHDPLKQLGEHRREAPKGKGNKTVVFRTSAWSICGRFCVSVGDSSQHEYITVMERWTRS